MAETNGIRVRLEFKAVNEIERCWYFVDFAKLKNIKHLRSDICNRFRLGNSKLDIYVEDYLLISEEAIHILRDNDLITVKQSQRNLTKNVKIDATESNKLRREKSTNLDEREKVLHRDVFLLESKKKKKPKKKPKPSDETMQHIVPSENIIFTPWKTITMNNQKYFVREENEESFCSDGHPDDSASKKKMIAAHNQLGILPWLAEKTPFSNCPPLVGIPRVDDLIAYRELTLTSDFNPQVSSHRVGKAISYCDGRVTLRPHKMPAPMLNGKLGICFDDEIDKDPTDEELVVLPVSALIDPKLVNELY